MTNARIAAAVSTVGPYVIESVLGEGGMGVVYRARLPDAPAPVAVKTVRATHPSVLASLRREVHALQRLDHPCIVRVIADDLAAAIPYYAMDLIESPTLASMLRDHATRREEWETVVAPATGVRAVTDRAATDRDPVADTPVRPGLDAADAASLLGVMRALCETLAFLHGEGFVHGDLKPANIFVRADGLPVLVDFGISRRFAAAGREVLDGTTGMHGTPAYMAPEQVRGELIDARADLYAVGGMLYEALVGRTPFDPGVAGLGQRLFAPPQTPTERGSHLAPALESLVMALLALHVDDRPGHALEVARRLAALGAPDAPTPLPAGRTYVYRPRLTGRAVALRALEDALDGALARRGRMALLSGESGAGKSYLAMAFAGVAAGRRVRVITGACAVGPNGVGSSGVPLQAFAEFFDGLADDCVSRGAAFTDALLGERGPVLAACAPRLATLPGQDRFAPPSTLGAQAARERLLDALVDTLTALADQAPLLLILDDLQWADDLTMEFLARLPPRVFEGRALMVLGTYRAEEVGDALGLVLAREGTAAIALEHLGPTDVASMLADMLATRAPPPALTEMLVARCDGNPFFVAEYVRTAVAEGLLRRDAADRWQVFITAGAAPLEPRSIFDLIARRLAGLTPGALALAQVASVLGREVDAAVLREVAGLPEVDLLERQQELLARQVWESADLAQLRFLHDKIRETAYEAIEAPRRASLHLAAARALEPRALADTSHAAWGALARHFLVGGDVPRALKYLERAGAEAIARFAHRDATAHLTELIALSERHECAATTLPQRLRRARWQHQLSLARFGLGDITGGLAHAVETLRWSGHPLPEGVGWVGHLLRAIPTQVAHRLRPGWDVPADDDARAAWALAGQAMQTVAECFYFAGAPPTIVASLLAVNYSERGDRAGGVPRAYAALGGATGLSKLPRLARRYFQLSHAAAERTADPRAKIYALEVQSAWKLGEGAWDEVRAHCDRALELATGLGDHREVAIVESLLAHADHFTGRYRSCIDRCDAVVRGARQRGDEQMVGWGLAGAARSHLPLGEATHALALLEEAHAIENVEIVVKVDGPGLLALARERTGDHDGALSMARLTTRRIRENIPVMFFMAVAGIAGSVEVYVTQAGRSPEVAAAARRALWELRAFAGGIVIARPVAALLLGRSRRAAGDDDGARAAWATGLRTAEALAMPYETAWLRAELAAAGPRGDARRGALRAAEEALRAIGCEADAERVRGLA